MGRVLHKHPSKYQQDCRRALQMFHEFTFNVIAVSNSLARIREQRLKNTPASHFCQEPSLGKHSRAAQNVQGRLEQSTRWDLILGTVGERLQIWPVGRNILSSLHLHESTGFFFATKSTLCPRLSGAHSNVYYFEWSIQIPQNYMNGGEALENVQGRAVAQGICCREMVHVAGFCFTVITWWGPWS